MGTLPSDGAGMTSPSVEPRRSEMDAAESSTMVAEGEAGACSKARSPTSKNNGNDAGKGNGKANEDEETKEEEDPVLLMMSNISDTESEDFALVDTAGAGSGSDTSSGDEETKEDDGEEEEEEKPIELELCDDSEAESQEEVELVLVGDELVEVPRGGRTAGGEDEDQDEDAEEKGQPGKDHEGSPQETALSAGRVRRAQAQSAWGLPIGGYTGVMLPEDEELMRAVVACEVEFADPTIRKLTVWGAIKTHCGRFASGHSAHSRVKWLRTVWKDESHRAHGGLSDELRRLLEQYELSAYGNATKTHWTDRNYGVTNAASRQLTIQSILEKLLTLEKPGAQGTNEVSRCDGVRPPASDSAVKLDPSTAADLKAIQDTDERFMKLVVQMRPLEGTAYRKTRVWAEIGQSTKNPRIKNGKHGRARLNYLVKVFQNPRHDEHAKLTPGLRKSISEYITSCADADVTERMEESSESSEHEDREDDDDQPASGLEDDVEGDVTTSENDALLREILRTRPFHAHRGMCWKAWNVVAARLPGGTRRSGQLQTGEMCLQQMRRLLRVVRHKKTWPDRPLPQHQVEMLTLIDKLIKTRWPRLEKDLSQVHRRLLREIDSIKENQEEISTTPSRSVATVSSRAGEENNPRLNPIDNGQLTDPEKPSRQGNKRKRSPPDEQPPVARASTELRRVSMDDSSLEVDQRHADEIKTLHTEVAMCRAQMTLQSTSFENERREHRADLRATMEMLKLEREASKRETKALLELLKQEQEDRKSQFVAMMNLVTRSIPQPPQDHE